MNTKGRKLFRYIAGIMTAMVLMGSAYATTAMASGIGMIDTAELLDVHAEASDSSAVVGQVMDEGHVAILERTDGWVQIKAGDIIGWVPEANLIETEISNEEAYEANEKIVAEYAEDVEDVIEALSGEETDADSEDSEETHEEDGNAEDGNTEDGNTEDDAAQEQTVAEDFSRDAELKAASEADSSEEQAESAAEEQKLSEEQEEAADEEQKPAEEQEKIAEEERRFAEEQVKAVAEAQKLATEQAKAVAEAQKLAAEQAKAVAEAQKLAAEQAKADAEAQKAAADEAVSADDLELLASIIYCEAKGEPYIGKVAVGSVVLNRVRSDKYPDTIRDVIYAKGQFSPVKNGSMAKALKNGSADESCYKAALEALAGSSPVGEKTSFRRVNGRSGQVIGHHVFY